MARRPTKTDQNTSLMMQGEISRRLKVDLESHIFDHEETVLTLLLGHYRSGTLTHDMMMGSIGEIVSLRRLNEKLGSDIQRGISAAEQEVGNG
jgi:hypothetical protein